VAKTSAAMNLDDMSTFISSGQYLPGAFDPAT
jgi:hypothetical protein